MEGCPRLPAIGFDPKVSIESVNLCEKIPNYITSTYQESGEKYANECEQMNRLRQNTINSVADESGVQSLKRYYCQLQLLRNRFPMLPETECAVRFTWEDAYQKEDNSYNDIRFEEACILYNLGAMYSRLGANESRRSNDSIKNACTHFRCAAACYEKVRDQYTTYSSDFTPDLLTCQVHILLAQAHEAVLEKSLLDQRPASINGHIAMQISEYYQTALLNLMKPGINSILSKRFREWRVALTYKLSYYLAVAYFFSGLGAEEAKKRGQAVCYYEAAVERLKEAWKNAEKISSDKTNVFKDAHTFTNDVMIGKHRAAKRDNDAVYFERVPTLSSLPAVQGVIVAKPQPFDCHDPDVCGADIFQKLVPLDAHLAASEYSEEKAKLLREIIELTENKSRELETFILCLQLNRVPLNNEYLRLPRELLDCCAAVAVRPNMYKDLVGAMQQLNSQHHEVTEQVNEFEQSLTTLEEDVGPIKSNKEYQELQSSLKSVREMMVQANDSNIELHRHMTTIIDHLKIFNAPLDQLEKNLPVITELDDENNKPKLARLALLNEKVETMKKQREMLLNDFRKKILDDDITKLVLMQRQDNHKTLFTEQLKKYEELMNIIKQNCAAQDNILQSLTEANADIADVRTKIAATFENRNRLVQDYVNSFKSFEDTLSKANEGIEFYRKQSAKLVKLNERVTTLQSQQKQQQLPTQRPSLHRQLPPSMPPRHSPLPTWSNSDFQEPDLPMTNLPPTMSDRPRLKDFLAAMKPDSWGSNTGRSAKRASMRREENMYIPPPMSNIPDNPLNNTIAPPSNHLYSSVPSTAGLARSSLTTFNPHHYPESSPIPFDPSSSLPQHRSPYQQQTHSPMHSNDPTPSAPMQSRHSQPQMIYAPPDAQTFTPHQQFPSSQSYAQHNPSMQHTLHQPSPSQPPFRQSSPTRHLNYQPPPPQQPTYQPPPPQQQVYQPPPPQQQVYQPPAPQQPVYQPPPPQQQFYQPPAPQQPVYQPPPPQQQVYQQPPPQQPVYQLQPQVYQPPAPQQPVYQPSIQQPVYQPPPPQQQFYQPPPPQQPVYQPAPPQQPIYQPHPSQQPMYQPPPVQQSMHPSFVQQQPVPPQQLNQQYMVQPTHVSPTQPPVVQQNPNSNDSNRSTQQPLPPKFDPYRPQPLGAYDIPKTHNSSSAPSIQAPTPPVQPQQIMPTQPRVNAQDVYRPGGPPAVNQSPVTSIPTNNNNYHPTQYVHYVPPSPPQPAAPMVPSPAPSTVTKAPVNTTPPQPVVSNIADDLLSIALEQQIYSSMMDSEPNSPEPQSPISVDEDHQAKTNGKPIACIQPLSIVPEEKPIVQPVVTPVASLNSPQDPYDDKEKLDQLVSDVQRFEKYVSTMSKKTLNGTIPSEVDWKELSDLQEKDIHTQTCAIGKCNPNLNRFQDLIPYDNSRIHLVQTNSNQQKHFNDYINATSIGRIRDALLLTAQYPLATTINDFWSMIYDQHVSIIAVLLRPDELQSINVYPTKVGEELKFSLLTITLLSTKSPTTLTNHRILRVQHAQTNQSRTVVWLEHLGWPPKEMPDNPVELLKFLDEVQHYLLQTRNRRSTILVTCFNGVSRTGPFLTLFTGIQDINEGRAFPDLNKIIRLLRSKRRHMIQDMNQLKFVYEAFLYYVQDLLVKRGVLKVGSINNTPLLKPSLSTTFNTALFDNEVQTIIDQAKPVVLPSVPNYDVGPILSSTITEEKSPVKQLTAIEENFNLRPEESHIKPKTKRDDFFRKKSSTDKDLADPFNQLDPLWTFRS